MTIVSPVKLLKQAWRLIWTTWSILLTGSLILLIVAVAIWEWQSRLALDPDQVTLMPPPSVVAEGWVDPFDELPAVPRAGELGVFYATARHPAEDGDPQRFYRNQRGYALRLGTATVQLGEGNFTWDEVKRISVTQERQRQYALSVTSVDDVGVLDDSLTPFDDTSVLADDPARPAREFARRLNQKLANSRQKDIFIYVHGYKVVFENPILVAGALWHFLGYDGAMIAFAWPATPNILAYVSDLETTTYSARHLRLFIQYLAQSTDVQRIHILGYSAGTGLVLNALDQLALLHADQDKGDVQQLYKLHNVVLVCSDVDRGIFGNQLADGAWKISRKLVIYVSRVDATLGMSRFLFQRRRLGQLLSDDQVREGLAKLLREQDHITLIDVSAAENVAANNGHAYFHKSPWVSSDLLLTFRFDLSPEERGLVRPEGAVLWHFPPDYLQRLADQLSASGRLGQRRGNADK